MYAGAAVRVITTNGRTPMFVAAEKGLGEMIRVMVEDCHVSTRNYFMFMCTFMCASICILIIVETVYIKIRINN